MSKKILPTIVFLLMIFTTNAYAFDESEITQGHQEQEDEVNVEYEHEADDYENEADDYENEYLNDESTDNEETLNGIIEEDKQESEKNEENFNNGLDDYQPETPNINIPQYPNNINSIVTDSEDTEEIIPYEALLDYLYEISENIKLIRRDIGITEDADANYISSFSVIAKNLSSLNETMEAISENITIKSEVPEYTEKQAESEIIGESITQEMNEDLTIQEVNETLTINDTSEDQKTSIEILLTRIDNQAQGIKETNELLKYIFIATIAISTVAALYKIFNSFF